MSYGSGAAVAAAIIARAIKASGAIVRVEPEDFQALLRRSSKPLIIVSEGGIFRKHPEYLMSYKGLAFFTKSAEPLTLPSDAEIISARTIWIPG